MEHSSYLNDALILLIAAVAVVLLFHRLRVSPILGYLFAGLIIGPKSLGFVTSIEGSRLLGELGVVFLLFTIGLKMPLQRLQVLRRYVFGLGLAQVIVTSAIIILILMYMGWSLDVALLTGSVLALSSTAVGIQLLMERGEIAIRFGRVSFAILLFQDLAVVVLLMLISAFKNDSLSILEVLGISTLKASVVLFVIILIGRLFLRPLFNAIAKTNNPQLFVSVTLLVVLIMSAATAGAGLSMELGAFLAGILLSETEYRHQVEADIQPFYGLLIGLFFMTVGMSLDPRLIVSHAPQLAIILTCYLSLKILIIFGLCLLFKIPKFTALRVGMLLASGGEFVFVIIAPSVTAQLITVELSQMLFTLVAISMAFTPFLANLGKYLEDKYSENESERHVHEPPAETMDLRNHVIIAGFGHIGRIIARILTEKLIPFVIIDSNLQAVSEGRQNGFPIFFGDARRAEMMRALGAAKARAALICFKNEKSAFRSAMMLTRQFPDLMVSVRLEDDEFEERLTQAGITVVTPQHLEPSLQLATKALHAIGMPNDEVVQTVDTFRRNFLKMSSPTDS
ncbi:MAG: cation:proton antiporter [Janthinobacterium lividum]